MTPLLEVRGLTSGYAGGTVLHGVDLAIEEGTVQAVLGRNGMGKSTLVNTIMGLVRPSAGSARLHGRELAGASPHAIARAGVAIVPQGRRVFAPLTVEQNLAIARRRGTHGPWTPERVYELLPALAARRGHRGDQLSGGEQQMLAIGRALVSNPRVLLLDEPSDGLAPAIVQQVVELVRALTTDGGLSVLLVEQELRSAFALAHHVVVLEKGRVAHRATMADFRSDPGRVRALLGVSAAPASASMNHPKELYAHRR